MELLGLQGQRGQRRHSERERNCGMPGPGMRAGLNAQQAQPKLSADSAASVPCSPFAQATLRHPNIVASAVLLRCIHANCSWSLSIIETGGACTLPCSLAAWLQALVQTTLSSCILLPCLPTASFLVRVCPALARHRGSWESAPHRPASSPSTLSVARSSMCSLPPMTRPSWLRSSPGHGGWAW